MAFGVTSIEAAPGSVACLTATLLGALLALGAVVAASFFEPQPKSAATLPAMTIDPIA
jgi:hypothetical protein